MRVFILILICFISLSSSGQIINASPPYRARASACSYLLDTYSGAAAAFSLRKLRAAYSGSAIRVRRSSDNTEQDIGFTGSCGDLDTASLKTFVGTGGTDDGFITVWYNQGSGGSTYDATQSTSASQPKIVASGVINRSDGGFPSIRAVSTSTADWLDLSPWHSSSDTYLYSFIVYRERSVGNFPYLIGSSPNDKGFAIYHNSNTQYLYCLTVRTGLNVASSTTAFTTDVTLLRTDFANRTNVGIYKNGSSISSVADQNENVNMATTYRLFSTNAAITYDHEIMEIILYNSDKSSNRSSIETAINTYYTIY